MTVDYDGGSVAFSSRLPDRICMLLSYDKAPANRLMRGFAIFILQMMLICLLQ